jgi:hypothetical protein
MTQYEDDYDIDYTTPSSQSGGQKPSPSDQDLNLDPYDDLLDVDTLDDASWDEPMPAAQPRKAMKSGKAVKGSKKSSLFMPLLIGGAVLVGLGIIYFQFSGSSAPTTPSTMPTPLPTAEMPVDPNNPNAINPNGMPAPTDPNMAGSQQPVVPAQGDLLALQQTQNDPNAMPQPMPQDAQPAPAPTGGLLNDPNLLPPANAPTPNASAPTMPMANDVQKAVPTAPVTDPAAVANVETPPAPAPAIVPEPQPAPTPAPVAEAPKETVAVQPTPSPTSAPAPDTTTISNKELEEMRATIARLESKVKELESKPVVTAATTSASSSSNLADEVAPAPKKKTTTKKKTSSSTSTKKKPADAGYIAKAKTPAKSSSWELRGIAGGEAIVAKRGSEDFQTIGVGDTLSGVGTITSISNQNGAWVIEGTNGKIRQ